MIYYGRLYWHRDPARKHGNWLEIRLYCSRGLLHRGLLHKPSSDARISVFVQATRLLETAAFFSVAEELQRRHTPLPLWCSSCKARFGHI